MTDSLNGIRQLSPAEKRRMLAELLRKEALEPRSYPLSFAQQRLWFLDRWEPDSASYNIPLAVELRGQFRMRALTSSIQEIVRRHEILRTVFATVDGHPSQKVLRTLRLPLPMIDLRTCSFEERKTAIKRLALEDAMLPFDLGRGPLLRMQLLRLEEQKHILLVNVHHIIFDGWSTHIFLQELKTLYQVFSQGGASPLPELPIQYADYAVWQRQWLQGKVLEDQLAYWKKQLQRLTPLELPLDYPRPAAQTFRGNSQTFTLPGELTAALKNLSSHEGVTLFMTLLAAFQVLLARYSGQEEVTVGSPIAGRARPETEGLIGFFVNTLVLRGDLSGDPSFRDLLGRVREMCVGAYAHQDLPFEKLVEELQPERDRSRNPLFQVMFTLQNTPESREEKARIALHNVDFEQGTAKFDLVVILAETGQGMIGDMNYNIDLFEAETIGRMAQHYHRILEAVVTNPDQRLSILPLLTLAERRKFLVELNATERTYSQEGYLHQLIEAQVEKKPDAIAVTCGDQQVTYEELNTRANQLGRQFIEHGVGAEVLVALFGERGIPYLGAMFAIFKAGGVYLPLDPLHPAKRLAQMVAQSGCRLICTTSASRQIIEHALEHIPARERPSLLLLDTLWAYGTAVGNIPPRCTPSNLAYILYTSGSTGAAKGVMVEHKGMLNHIRAKIADVQLSSADYVAQNGPQCFDISVWQSFAPLVVGGKVHIFKDEVAFDPALLIENVASGAISVLQLVPSLLREIISYLEASRTDRAKLAALRWIVPTGDALPVELCRRWLNLYPTIPLLNTYGSTECSDDQCHFVIDRPLPRDKTVSVAPLGFPIPNMQVYVLDRALLPVPVGVAGELYIGGIGVGRGYLNESVRTALAFIPNPFARKAGERLYKTGDLVCYLPDGNLKFLGRSDYLTKIRGYRIETGEIEVLLEQHQAVREAVVLVQSRPSGEKYLAAYVVPQSGTVKQLESRAVQIADTTEYVTQWRDVYDTVYRSHHASSLDPTINLRMWTDSYTRQPLSEEAILACINDTVQRILDLNPDRLLEIGCGTGQLLSRIAPHCTFYSGIDFSREALDSLEDFFRANPQNWRHVHLTPCPAHELPETLSDSFDTIILNEVVQYFPSAEYLIQVLRSAVQRLSAGGTLFIGGVRSLPLLEMFHLSLLLHQVPASLSLRECHQLLQKKREQEKELALDPAFFVTLKRYIPEISSVQVQLKGGRHHNEFTLFRYDVVLRTGKSAPVAEPNLTSSFLSWKNDGLDVLKIQHVLVQKKPALLRITGVPNARLKEEAKALEFLTDAPEDATIADLRRTLQDISDVSRDEHRYAEPEDLWRLGVDHAYEVYVYWPARCVDGSYDIILRRRGEEGQGIDMSAVLEADERQLPEVHANTPLQNSLAHRQSELEQELVSSLSSYLRERLPEYMVPTTIMVIDTMPLNANGKVDRHQLPVPDLRRGEVREPVVEPSDQVEYQLLHLFEEILETRPIGVRDNFFSLGGHSLSSVRLIARIQKTFNQDIPLSTLFHGPTVAQLAKLLRQTSASRFPSNVVALQPEGEGHPFFCIHAAGGGVTSYTHLARHLGKNRPFYGVQVSALYEEEEPLQCIEDMATCYISAMRAVQPEGPYTLGGWSAGGLVAFEIALQLCEQGQEVALLAILDTWAPVRGYYPPLKDNAQWIAEVVQHFAAQTAGKTFPALLSEADLRKLSPLEQELYMVDMGKHLHLWPEDVSIAQIRRYLDVFRANVTAEYNYCPQKSYPNKITLFKSREMTQEFMREIQDWDLKCDLSDQTMGWGTFSSQPVEVHLVPGDHFLIVEEPHVQVVAEQLGRDLDRIEERLRRG
ncbi:MAG TPA: amino acid adenylation domain-containing protein [Ktedonobacteraceae bacterium]|nr:amino acid adenylation domain-containing protein [Ktedonobacteraceae bacterium]